MLPDFVQSPNDTMNREGIFSLGVWRLNIHGFTNEGCAARRRVMRGLARGGWTGMAFSEVSDFEMRAVRRWASGRAALLDDNSAATTDDDGYEFPTSEWAVWLPAALYPDLLGFVRSLPRRVHEIPVGCEAVPAMQQELLGLNWMVATSECGGRRVLSVQDCPRILPIRVLARLTLA